MDLLRNANGFRYISTLAVFQYALIVATFCGVGVVMKFAGYPEIPENGYWNPIALFMRTKIGLLMLAPLVWVFFTILIELKSDSDFSRLLSLAFVMIFALLLCVATIYSALCPAFFSILRSI